MSHKCLRCGKIYQDNDSNILRGCSNCGSIFFLYMKSEQEAKQLQKIEEELQQKNTSFEEELAKQLTVKKPAEISATEEVSYEIEMPQESQGPQLPKMSKAAEKKASKLPRKQKFGIETIRVPREGLYEINIEALMERRPIIVLEKGKVYFIHLPSAFEKVRARE